MDEAMKSVRYAFMDLRNIMRLFSRNKKKDIIIKQIDITILTLENLKSEIFER